MHEHFYYVSIAYTCTTKTKLECGSSLFAAVIPPLVVESLQEQMVLIKLNDDKSALNMTNLLS